MRRYRFWLMAIVLGCGLLGVVLVKDRLEQFLGQLREQGSYNLNFLGHHKYIESVFAFYGADLEKDAPYIKAIASRLNQNELHLSQILDPLAELVLEKCVELGACQAEVLQFLRDYAGEKIDSLHVPEMSELTQDLERDLMLQIQLLHVDERRYPTVFALQPDVEVEGVANIHLPENQQKLLRFYDPTARNFVLVDEETIVKNIAHSQQLGTQEEESTALNCCFPRIVGDSLSLSAKQRWKASSPALATRGKNAQFFIVNHESEWPLVRDILNRFAGEPVYMLGLSDIYLHDPEFLVELLAHYQDVHIVVPVGGDTEIFHWRWSLIQRHSGWQKLLQEKHPRLIYAFDLPGAAHPLHYKFLESWVEELKKGAVPHAQSIVRPRGREAPDELSLIIE